MAARVYQGVPASPGIACGPAFVVRTAEVAVDFFIPVAAGEVEAEVVRLDRAVEATRVELQTMRRGATRDEADILFAHLQMLDDPELAGAARSLIREQRLGAPAALYRVVDQVSERLRALSDPALRERAADVRDVGRRITHHLRGLGAIEVPPHPGCVVIARELYPCDAMILGRRQVVAFATEMGGRASHAAIVARALGIPAVVGCADCLTAIANDETVLVDGDRGLIVVSPGSDLVEQAAARQAEWSRRRPLPPDLEPAITRDGHRVQVCANVAAPEDVDEAASQGADGIGLMRTEFLFMGRADPPSEDEQFEAYRTAAERMTGRPVVIRVLDAGGDKPLAYLPRPLERNPALGWRGIRLMLAQPEVLEAQLRAILRAARHGSVQVLLPMVATAQELMQARRALERARGQLVERGLTVPKVALGAMIEVPAAALAARQLARLCDFLSIGTNDLVQYLFAADRQSDKVGYLHDATHPIALRLIRQVVRAAHAVGRPVHICGEVAGEPDAAPVLVGLGVDELSMAPTAIPAVKAVVRALTLDEAQCAVRRAVRLRPVRA
jgi:phosphotransferase system enzyme I (PtsI)